MINNFLCSGDSQLILVYSRSWRHIERNLTIVSQFGLWSGISGYDLRLVGKYFDVICDNYLMG